MDGMAAEKVDLYIWVMFVALIYAVVYDFLSCDRTKNSNC